METESLASILGRPHILDNSAARPGFGKPGEIVIFRVNAEKVRAPQARARHRGWTMLAGWLLLTVSAPVWSAPRVEVDVTGVTGEIHDAVLSNLSLQRERNHPLLSEHRIQRLHRRAADEIKNALRPFGYYSPEISSEISHEGELWEARYVVTPGRPVRVSRLEIVIEGPGAGDSALDQWRESFPLQRGDVFVDRPYEEAKDGLLRLVRERGYLDAELVEHEVQVNASELSAGIRLRIVTGARFTFGEVSFEQVPLRESLLTRYADFSAGEPYDAEKLYQFHRDLTNSDYFERVEVVPRTDGPVDGAVPVDVGLTMRKRNRYTAGLGYGTDTGPRASLGFERRWLNEHGHRFGSQAVVSEVRSSIDANYRIPLDRPATDFLGFTGSREREETDTAVRDTSTVGANVTHQWGRWLRTVALNYQEENFEVGEESSTRSTMLYPAVTFQRVEADDRLLPSRGWRLTVEARAAEEDYWSSTSLVQGRVGGKAVFAFLGGRVLPRFDVGSSYVSNFDQLPVSLRFFAGGDQSVRGFEYQSLGPVDSNGDVVGGSNLLVGSVEYDYYTSGRMGFALFTDWGNAFNSFDDYDLHQGAGVGLRWRLPFGVVRVDAASAISRPDQPWRLHLTIGPDL